MRNKRIFTSMLVLMIILILVGIVSADSVTWTVQGKGTKTTTTYTYDWVPQTGWYGVYSPDTLTWNVNRGDITGLWLENRYHSFGVTRATLLLKDPYCVEFWGLPMCWNVYKGGWQNLAECQYKTCTCAFTGRTYDMGCDDFPPPLGCARFDPKFDPPFVIGWSCNLIFPTAWSCPYKCGIGSDGVIQAHGEAKWTFPTTYVRQVSITWTDEDHSAEARLVLKIETPHTKTETLTKTDSGSDSVTIADETKNLGGFSATPSGATGVTYALSDNKDKVITWFSTGEQTTTSASATIWACLDDNSNGICDYTECFPETCSSLGKECGTWDDGCGVTLNCGTCTAFPTSYCDDGTCACAAETCASLGKECGLWDDECGGTLDCGACPYTNSYCDDGTCKCTPDTCDSLGKECGTWDDGCGVTLECGICEEGECMDGICMAEKYDWDHNKTGICPLKECYKSIPSEECVLDEYFPNMITYGDHYCENGQWTTRTKLVALQLLNFSSEEGAADDYTLFCDDYEKALNYYGYASESLAGIDKICVLRLNPESNDRVILGTPLAYDVEHITTQNLMDLIGDSIDCENTPLHSCQGSGGNVWYDSTIQSIYFSINPIQLEEISFLQAFINFLKNPFQAIFDMIIDILKPEGELFPIDYNFIQDIEKFDKIYLARKNIKNVHGVVEKVGQNKTLIVNYECFSSNICSTVNKYKDPDLWVNCSKEGYSYYVTMSPKPGLDSEFPAWKDLTVKLRPKDTDFECLPCTDSDGGINYYVKGGTVGTYYDPLLSETREEDIMDMCITNPSWSESDIQALIDLGVITAEQVEDPNVLIEGYCSDSGYLNFLSYTCSNGCQDGACVSEPTLCNVEHSTTCSSGTKILAMSSDTDAHASYAGDTNFEYSLCCNIDGSVAVKDGCSADEKYLISLSGKQTAMPIDQHVGDTTNYYNDVCLTTADITECTIKDSCIAGEECVAEISDTTDAHIAECGYGFNKKICCSLS